MYIVDHVYIQYYKEYIFTYTLSSCFSTIFVVSTEASGRISRGRNIPNISQNRIAVDEERFSRFSCEHFIPPTRALPLLRFSVKVLL